MRLVVATILLAATVAHADDDNFGTATIIFQRGNQLVRADPRDKSETPLATLPDKAIVRALRTDAAAKVLLADVGGAWQWMPLEGAAKGLADLPCGDGPAQLAEDGTAVLCRAKTGAAILVTLGNAKPLSVDVPAGARLAGTGPARVVVWTDKDGVWSAPPRDLRRASRVAADPPLRGLAPSPDGTRAVGVYSDEVYIDAHHKQPADVLMVFALDGIGARRKVIQKGVAVEWSHDSQWLLVQNGAEACLMRASGGDYKCWRGYTAASIAADGKFALVLGNRDGSKRQTPATKKKPDSSGEAENPDEAVPVDDVAVPPPTGPLALYRIRLEGSPYTESPALVTKVIDGAAVWVPGK